MLSLRQETVSQTIGYTYDPLGRLTAADYSTGDYYHYTYDAVGNRLYEENVTNGGMPNDNDYTYNEANWLLDMSGATVSTCLNLVFTFLGEAQPVRI
jgi:YD repeat-containing protein